MTGASPPPPVGAPGRPAPDQPQGPAAPLAPPAGPASRRSGLPRAALGAAGTAFDRLLQAVVCLLYVAIVVVVNVAVFYRYVLDSPIIWSDTVGIWLFIWMAMLAAALAIPRRAHMAVDVLPSLVPGRVALVLRVLYFASFIAVGYLLAVSGFELAEITGDRVGTAVDLPLRYAMLAIPVGALLFCVQGARALFRLARDRDLDLAPPGGPRAADDPIEQPEQLRL